MTPLPVSSCQGWLAVPPKMCSFCHIALLPKVVAQGLHAQQVHAHTLHLGETT